MTKYTSTRNTDDVVTNIWYSITADGSYYSPDMGEAGTYTVSAEVLTSEEEDIILARYALLGVVP